MIISVLNTPLRIHTSSTFPTTFSVLMSSEDYVQWNQWANN